MKLSKIKKKKRENPKNSQRKIDCNLYETLIRLSANFSAKTLHVRRVEWYMQSFEGKINCEPRILYSANLSFRNEEEIKTPKQTKGNGVHHQENCLTRNAERGSIDWNEKKNTN